MHARTEHERKTELYGYKFSASQKLTRSFEISIPHCVAVQRRTSRRWCPELDPLRLLGAPWGSLSSSSLLHDASIAPSFQSPRVVLDDITSSWHGVFKAGLASESQRIHRYERRNISLVPYSCRLLQSSTLQNTLQPRPALSRTSSQSNARHDPKNGQARKQIHIPLVHEVIGRCPGRISYPMTN